MPAFRELLFQWGCMLTVLVQVGYLRYLGNFLVLCRPDNETTPKWF